MPPVGFEPTISAAERPQTYSLDRAITGITVFNFANYPYSKFITHSALYEGWNFNSGNYLFTTDTK